MDIIVFIGIKHHNVTSHLDIFQYQSHWLSFIGIRRNMSNLPI